MLTDPISDLLCQIRNANHRMFEKVDVPTSKLKVSIAKLLKSEGFIANYKVMEDVKKKPFLRIYLKYAGQGNKIQAIAGLKRISKPSLRVYRAYETFARRTVPGMVTVVSTSKGLLTDRQAFQSKLGGEVLCQVW
jgi:small subunit ribosomal protein S8